MLDLNGHQLGRYRIDRPIGRGGMAVVYLAHDSGLNRPVAVKVMDPAMSQEPGAVERFRREAITAANLEHPHIMPVYDVREEEGLWYLAMRYVPGETLRDVLRRQGALPLDRIVRLLRPLADALDYAHAHGVTHRDIKPGNILIEPDGNVVLTDFGIARSGSDVHLTRAGQVMGTADYLAPEQIRGGEATPASDLYALGVLLYEMLTGRTPFAGETAAEILYKQVNDPPQPLRGLRPDLPASFQAVIDRALNKNPALRYPTGRALAQAVAAAAGPLGGVRPTAGLASAPGARPAGLPPAGTPPTGTRPPGRPSGAPARPAPRPASGGWQPRSILSAPGAARAGQTPLLVGGGLVILLILGALAWGLLHARTPGGSPALGGDPTSAPGEPAPFNAVAPARYTGPGRQGNGPDLHANQSRRAPAIDGRLDDWAGANQWPAASAIRTDTVTAPKSPADLSAGFLLGYDATTFYLGAIITDDVHVQNARTRDQELWKGDDVELWFDTNLPGDFTVDPGNADDFQLGFSPGDFAQLGPQAVFFRPTPGDAGKAGVRVAAVPRADGKGYTLEAAIPWAALQMQPPDGGAVGFCASAGDNDVPGTAQQQHLVSTCTRMQWNVPTTFGMLFW